MSLSWARSTQSPPPFFFLKIRFSITLPFTLTSSMGCQVSSPKVCMHLSPVPATCPTHHCCPFPISHNHPWPMFLHRCDRTCFTATETNRQNITLLNFWYLPHYWQAQGQVFIRVLRPSSITVTPPLLHIHSSINDATESQELTALLNKT